MLKMPARHVIDIANRVVLTVFTGILTMREATENRKRLYADSSFEPSFSELIDFTAVSQIELDRNEFQALMENDPFSTVSKRAFVVSLPESIYGAAQMYRIMRDNRLCVAVFNTVGEALRWLST
jgi:hypothetical protein